MFCSISTGKSGSNWLDRLRSSKGFPTANDLDLEQFLNHHNPNLSNSSHTEFTDSTANNIDTKSKTDVLDRKKTTEIPRENGEKEWFGIMSSVLAELFHMGEPNDFPRINPKKSCRKQPNPRICVVSTSPSVDDVRRDEGVLATSDDNSGVEIKERSGHMKLSQLAEQEEVNVGLVDGEEEEKCQADLSAFSRTEVTVIDTSCPSWKFQKMLFRRKNVWKVRDKKCKAMNIGKRKRKESPLNENVGEEKKPKLYIAQSSKSPNEEEGIVSSNEGHDQSDKLEEARKKMPHILSQVPEKTFPKKLKKVGSSVVLIKSIPTIKKNGSSIPKSCLKLTERQYKAS